MPRPSRDRLPRARCRPLRAFLPGAVPRMWLLLLDDAALRIVTPQGRPGPGVTFPLRMSSLPVTCRSPPRAWHSGDEGGFMTRIPSHSIEDAPQAARSLLADMVPF